MQEDEESHQVSEGSRGVPAMLKPAALPAAALPSIAETPLDHQQAVDTDSVTVALSVGLSTIPEEPEEASLPASGVSAPQAADLVDAEPQDSQSRHTLPSARAEPNKGASGSEAAGTAASTSKLPMSVPSVEACQPGTPAPSHSGVLAAAHKVSVGNCSLLQLPEAADLADCSPEGLMQHAERVVARQLAPLPVLTALDTCSPGKTTPHVILSAALHAAHAVPSVDSRTSAAAPSFEHAGRGSVPQPDPRSMRKTAHPGTVEDQQGQITPAAALHSRSGARPTPSTMSLASRAVSEVPRPVADIGSLSHPRSKEAAGDATVNRISTAAAAAPAVTRRSGDKVLARHVAAGRPHGVQIALPNQALKMRHVAAPAPAFHALRPAGDHLRPVIAALNLLLDADSIKVSGYVPGRQCIPARLSLVHPL